MQRENYIAQEKIRKNRFLLESFKSETKVCKELSILELVDEKRREEELRVAVFKKQRTDCLGKVKTKKNRK